MVTAKDDMIDGLRGRAYEDGNGQLYIYIHIAHLAYKNSKERPTIAFKNITTGRVINIDFSELKSLKRVDYLDAIIKE